MSEISHLSWHNCYKQSWGKEIVPEAYGHPAKAARGLARRIYAHAIERGYLRPGDTCLDPFAGIGGFALDALANGLNWFGAELERNFVDMGAGCDCTGISKDDWVACFGRWDRFRYKDDRHWCPRCLAEAEGVIEPRPPSLPGMEPEPTASYQRNSGKIPRTEPHRYMGNLGLFAKHARGGATAVLVQGDSRRLVEVLEGARAEGIIASPPWSSSLSRDGRSADDLKIVSQLEEKYDRRFTNRSFPPDDYGTDPAQLGNMPTGEPPQVAACISSPPYINAVNPHDEGPGMAGNEARRKRIEAGSESERAAQSRKVGYGKSDGQLGTMREGDAPTDYTYTPGSLTPTPFDAKAVVESITFTTAPKREEAVECEWEEEGVDGIISSPPWASTEGSHSAAKFRDPEGSAERRAEGYRSGKLKGHGASKEAILRAMQKANQSTYGMSDGQLAALPEGEPPQVGGLVSSPPYEGSMSHEDHGIDWSKAKKDYPGRLMHPQRTAMLKRHHDERRYGSGTDNLGNQQGNTFWSAAKTILDQCHAVLAPGGVAIWVLKAFVRNKAIVDFPGQWEALCNSCGFETIEVIRAWLVEDRGAQFAFNGDLVKRRVAHKSFFRRLYEAKARAAEFWKSVGRDDKARHLRQAHRSMWANYRLQLKISGKSPPYPTRARTLSEAQTVAYVEAGKPDVEIDTQIDYEVVLVTRKGRERC